VDSGGTADNGDHIGVDDASGELGGVRIDADLGENGHSSPVDSTGEQGRGNDIGASPKPAVAGIASE